MCIRIMCIKTCEWSFPEVSHSLKVFGFISASFVCILSCIFIFLMFYLFR